MQGSRLRPNGHASSNDPHGREDEWTCNSTLALENLTAVAAAAFDINESCTPGASTTVADSARLFVRTATGGRWALGGFLSPTSFRLTFVQGGAGKGRKREGSWTEHYAIGISALPRVIGLQTPLSTPGCDYSRQKRRTSRAHSTNSPPRRGAAPFP